MGFFKKLSIGVVLIVAILIGYCQINKEPPLTAPIPIEETYWGYGKEKQHSDAIHEFKVR